MAARWCCAVLCVLLAPFSLIDSYPYPERDVNDSFYEELRKLITEKVGELKTKAVSKDNSISARPPKPREVPNWPVKSLTLGQVSGVSVNTKNQPVIFHRADRTWDISTFDAYNRYLQRDKGPIREDTVLTLDPGTGSIVSSWGSNLFYMPHGITMDLHDNYWVTDVALHQVFKFRDGNATPVLEFGTPFQSGSSLQQLCKPTAVAVASTGEVFIADGYCNQRVLKFNAAGGLLRIIPNPPEFLSLLVPHGLALLEDQDRICIADRENMRVTCPRAGLHTLRAAGDATLTISEPDLGRVYDIAARGDFLYAVNGPTNRVLGVMGFTMDPMAENIIDHWTPISQSLQNPHAIAVSPNGTALYVAEIKPNRIWKFDLVK